MSATRKGNFKTVKVNGGKEYIEVAERVRFLSQDFDGDYSISTEYNYFESRKMWVVKATLTLYMDKSSFVYTGLAQEIESTKGVNSTSALENAETSAVGRACAMAGIGIIGGIASLDEINKAKNRSQEQVPTPSEPEEPEFVPMMAIEQRTQLLLLLKNPAFTKEELKKGESLFETYTYERANEVIEKTKAELQKRQNLKITNAA